MGKRVDIKTGFLCNNNCIFCVQAHKKMHGNRPTADVLEDIRLSRQDCDGVVLTGGEVSIREDFFDLLRYSRKMGYEVIQAQSNGRRFCYPEFAKEAVLSGMTEFAPALHGATAEQHDSLTRARGSFEQTVQGIINVRKLGIRVVANTVVVRQNFRSLPEIAKLLTSLGVSQYQFAFVHAIGNAEKNYVEVMPRVSEASAYIRKGLQVGIDAGLRVMAEAIPYCQMGGYEQYVSEQYIPDTEIRDVTSFDPDFSTTRREKGKVKFKTCRACRFDSICEGPWKEYPERMGSEEFKPVAGPAVRSFQELRRI